jgi:radical SAM superfamily enzyme YgiQ (UPF0313 family)/intein/homing endonuclease
MSDFSVSISYPPLNSKRGIAFLSQNRQFQWTHTDNVIYPVIPASAASLLQSKGFKVYWDDAIAQRLSFQQWLKRLVSRHPNLIVIETKTPVIQQHWRLIKTIKKKLPQSNIVLMGDHVTALPHESLKKCPVNFILKGGDYDLLLLSLVTQLSAGKKPSQIIDSTPNHHLDQIPITDRQLTRWQDYAYRNSNFKYTPGAYIMSGRDCWWGKCTFCVTGQTQIFTSKGLKSIGKIVKEKKDYKVLTHTGKYKKIIDWQQRKINEEIVSIKPLYFPLKLELTKKHKVFCLPKAEMKHCSFKSGWSYYCIPNRTSRFLKCDQCTNKHHQKYLLKKTEAEKIKVGDFLAFPINRQVSDIKSINIKQTLSKKPTVFFTLQKISKVKIKKIIKLYKKKQSQRSISRELSIDRETVKRYISLQKTKSLNKSINLYQSVDNKISFKWGVNKIHPDIPINNDTLFLIGLYLAEGCTHHIKDRPNSATISWTFYKKERKLITKTKTVFHKYFGVSLNQTLNKKNNTKQLALGSTIVAKFFKNLFGHNCYHKKIPHSFLKLPISKQRFLLKGLFAGDGHLRKRNSRQGGSEYILETTSKQLAEQTFQILLRFNAIPGFKIKEPRKQNESIQYRITLSHQDILKVFPSIKLKVKSHTYKRGFILDNYALIPVIEVQKKVFNGYVYNLTVEHDHSYIANFITATNCSWTTLFPRVSYRRFSVDHAIAEIENLVNLGAKEIFDDSGTLPVGDWLENFCQQIIDKGLNKKCHFGCNMRFGALSQKNYQLMAKAGFRLILFGFESANLKTLKKINKNINPQNIPAELAWAKKAGLEPHITVMIGYPWETLTDAQKTLDFARNLFKQNLVSSLQATRIIPYPGTPLFSYCQKNNLLLTQNWANYDMSRPIIKSPISAAKQQQMIKDLFKGVISPKFLINQILSLRNFSDIKHLANYSIKFLQKLKDF